MTRRKANVRPDLVGELFVNQSEPEPRIPYRLVNCDTEPRALMAKVTETAVPNVPGLPISEFKDYVLLKPVLPRVRKPIKERKPRSDKGKPHKKAESTERC